MIERFSFSHEFISPFIDVDFSMKQIVTMPFILIRSSLCFKMPYIAYMSASKATTFTPSSELS